jgi:hypothetical protein
MMVENVAVEFATITANEKQLEARTTSDKQHPVKFRTFGKRFFPI